MKRGGSAALSMHVLGTGGAAVGVGALVYASAPWWVVTVYVGCCAAVSTVAMVFPQDSQHRLSWWERRWEHRRHLAYWSKTGAEPETGGDVSPTGVSDSAPKAASASTDRLAARDEADDTARARAVGGVTAASSPIRR